MRRARDFVKIEWSADPACGRSPGRSSRPERFVVVLRGIPGAGAAAPILPFQADFILVQPIVIPSPSPSPRRPSPPPRCPSPSPPC
eukprot:2079087-Pleurochrysis_carterae.AAC.1